LWTPEGSRGLTKREEVRVGGYTRHTLAEILVPFNSFPVTTGSQHPFIGLELVCDISIGIAKRAVRDWMNITHTKQWESKTGLKQAKGLISWHSAKITKYLLGLNRDQLRWMVGLFTGHCHLKGHLFKLGLTDYPFVKGA
jgi:hypothetical protein